MGGGEPCEGPYGPQIRLRPLIFTVRGQLTMQLRIQGGQLDTTGLPCHPRRATPHGGVRGDPPAVASRGPSCTKRILLRLVAGRAGSPVGGRRNRAARRPCEAVCRRGDPWRLASPDSRQSATLPDPPPTSATAAAGGSSSSAAGVREPGRYTPPPARQTVVETGGGGKGGGGRSRMSVGLDRCRTDGGW